MYPEYFNNRNDKKYNLDNLYKKYLPIYNIVIDETWKNTRNII